MLQKMVKDTQKTPIMGKKMPHEVKKTQKMWSIQIKAVNLPHCLLLFFIN